MNKDNYSLWIGNIPFDVTEKELHEILSTVGDVTNVRIKYDIDKNVSKGFAFCEYKDLETCILALRYINGYELKGRKLRLYWASDESKDKISAINTYPYNDYNVKGSHDNKKGINFKGYSNTIVVNDGGTGFNKNNTLNDSNTKYNSFHYKKGGGTANNINNKTGVTILSNRIPLYNNNNNNNNNNNSNNNNSNNNNNNNNNNDKNSNNNTNNQSVYLQQLGVQNKENSNINNILLKEIEQNNIKVNISNIIHTLTTTQIIYILTYFQKYALKNYKELKIYLQKNKNVAYGLLHCLFLLNIINEHLIINNESDLLYINNDMVLNKKERIEQLDNSKIKISLNGNIKNGGMFNTESGIGYREDTICNSRSSSKSMTKGMGKNRVKGKNKKNKPTGIINNSYNSDNNNSGSSIRSSSNSSNISNSSNNNNNNNN
uniref:RRM domain-containing protein n=1 Tax=Piliocolobus tephrosceles TaxID=591936 RepID=A0A8C9GJY9_9PRIM